jgi:hypothetical protein
MKPFVRNALNSQHDTLRFETVKAVYYRRTVGIDLRPEIVGLIEG